MRRTIKMAFGARVVVCMAVWLSFLKAVIGGEVPRVPPADCEQALRGLLTPFEKIPKEASDAQDRGGVMLLSEEINLIEPDGKRLLVTHSVSKALNEAGAKQLEEQSFSFRKKEQKIYLAQARTVQPDGSSLAVKPDAAFFKSPQPGADDSIYDDVGEVVVLFPNVKPGSITETTFIYEEPSFRIPGEFTFYAGWVGGWPVAEMRSVVEIPTSLAARLKFATVGDGVPSYSKQESGGRVRYTWSAKSIAAASAEPHRAPESQVGPSLWGSTLADWNAFAAWYGALLEGRDKLSPALSKRVEEWTKDARGPRDIADILAMKVSKEVRYLGLEFGRANLQPHDCNEVWENQYGDCKDKANLLRAMLAQKGIRSHLVLLNSEHSGKIQKATPDYRGFNHAILAIEGLIPNSYLFCDPTVPYAKADTLAPSDSDRDLLLIKGKTAEWVHSPKAATLKLNYDFDLTLGSAGELSGWLSEESSGVLASSYAWHFERLDTPSTRSQLQSILSDLYSGAEITDFQKIPLKDWDGTYRLKMHFAVPSAGANRELTASFPNSQTICPNLGTIKERTTPFFQAGKRTSVALRIKLPPGYSPREIPKNYRVDGDALTATASWHLEEGICAGQLSIEQHSGLFSPAQFLEEINALGSLQAWVAQPILLTAKASAPGNLSAENSDEDSLPDFPKLSNGSAQLELVEKIYPLSGDLQKRYLALKKTLEYFPSDKTTRFIATVAMANQDRQNHKAFEAASSLEAFLKAQRKSNPGVGVELLSWGDYIYALALSESDRNGEAAAVFKRLAETPGVPKERKAWSRYLAAWILQKDSAQKACSILLPAIQENTSAQSTSLGLLAQIQARSSKTKELKPVLQQYFRQENANLEETLNSLDRAICILVQSRQPQQAQQLLEAIESAAQSTPAADRVKEAFLESGKLLKAGGNAEIIQKDLKQFLESNPQEFEKISIPESLKTRADFERSMQSAKSTDLYLRYGFEMLTRFPADPNDPYSLFMLGVSISTQQQTSNDFHLHAALLREIFHIFDQFPEGDGYYHSGKLLQAWVLRSRGSAQSAKGILEKLLQEPNLPQGTQRDATRGLAQCEEALGQYAKALDHYKALEDKLDVSANRQVMLRPALLSLELGNPSEALRILKLLKASVPPKQWSPTAQYTELVQLADSGKAEAYWNASAEWWKTWESLELRAGIEKPDRKAVILEGSELTALNTALQTDFARKDRQGFLKHFQSMIHLGRWQPSAALEACRLAHIYVPTLAPELTQSFSALSLEILDHFVPGHPDARLAEELRIIHLANSGKADKSLERAQKFLASDTTNDLISQDIKRVRAHDAVLLSRDLEPAAISLEVLLSSPKLFQYRAATVWYLSQVYKKLGRTADERRLIEEEMKKTLVSKDAAFSSQLQARLAELQRAALAEQKTAQNDPSTWFGKLNQNLSTPRPNSFPPIEFPKADSAGAKASADSSNLLTSAVVKWLPQNRPVWFDYAEPKDLGKYPSSELETLLKEASNSGSDGAGGLAPAEIVKLGLLVAQNPSLPEPLRQLGFEMAFRRLISSCKTWQESRELAASVIENFEFPEKTRVVCLCIALEDAASHENRSLTDHYLSDPLAKRMTAYQRSRMEPIAAFARTDLHSDEKVQVACDSFACQPLTKGGAHCLDLFFRALLRLDKLEQAKKLNETIGKIPPDLQNSNLPTWLQFNQLPKLKEASEMEPLHRALVAMVQEKYPGDLPEKAPEIFASVHDARAPKFLSEEDLANLILFRVKEREVFADHFNLWVDLSSSIRERPHGKELVHDLLNTALRTAPDDKHRAMAIEGLLQQVDMDDPDERVWVLNRLQSFQADPTQNETLAKIQLTQARSALRAGQAVDLEKAFANTKTTLFQRGILALKLRYYLNVWNLPALKSVVDSIGSNDLIHPFLLPYTIPALDALGMTTEAEVARSAGKRELYRAVLDSWATGQFARARFALLLSGIIGNAPLPAEWFDALEKTQNKEDQTWIRIQAARAKKEWQTVADLCAEGEKLPSHVTPYYWYQAEALYELGKPAEASKPLEIFLARGLDWPDYPAACRLRKKIQGKL